jgi:hypothetical protein
MELMDVLPTRRSIRKYLTRPVPEEAIRTLIKAAMSEPENCSLFLKPDSPSPLSRWAGLKMISPPPTASGPNSSTVTLDSHRKPPQ